MQTSNHSSEVNSFAISGIGICSQHIANSDNFTRLLFSDQQDIHPIPDSHLLHNVIRFGNVLEPSSFPDFDLIEIDLQRDQLNQTLRRQTNNVHYACHAVAQALSQSRILSKYSSDEIALVVSGGQLDFVKPYQSYQRSQESLNFISPSYIVQCLDSNYTGLFSACFKLNGTALTVSNASASSHAAIHTAQRLLSDHKIKAVLIAAPPMMLSPLECQSLKQAGALANHEHIDDEDNLSCPFDESRYGFIYSQIAAAMVLEKVNPQALAVCHDVSINLDATNSTNPDASGQYHAMQNALQFAACTPSCIDAVAAHATGSKAGDPVECQSLAQLLKDSKKCPSINSVKSITGHALSASGLVSSIAACCQLQQQAVHGNLGLHQPINNRLNLPTHAEKKNVNVILCNGFAFGGINCAYVIRSN